MSQDPKLQPWRCEEEANSTRTCPGAGSLPAEGAPPQEGAGGAGLPGRALVTGRSLEKGENLLHHAQWERPRGFRSRVENVLGRGPRGKPEPALASPVSWGEWRAMARATDSRSICKAPVFPHLGIDRC